MSIIGHSEKQNISVTLATLLALFGTHLFAQCSTRVWDPAVRSANLAQFQSFVPAKMSPRFSAKLTQTDWLIFYEVPRPLNEPVPHDEGFEIVRNSHVVLRRSLMSVPAWRDFARSVKDNDPPAIGIAAGQVCGRMANTVAVAFQACCTTTSALLYFIAVSSGGAYRVTALPMGRGGKLELSQTSPVRLDFWDETDDGSCDGCLQHYKITQYRIVSGEPVFVHRFTSSRRFEAAEFDPNRIALLPLGR